MLGYKRTNYCHGRLFTHLQQGITIERVPVDGLGVQLDSRQVSVKELPITDTFFSERKCPAYLQRSEHSVTGHQVVISRIRAAKPPAAALVSPCVEHQRASSRPSNQ